MKHALAFLLALTCLLLCACGAAETRPEDASAENTDSENTNPEDANTEPSPTAETAAEAGLLVEPVYPSMAPQPNQEDYLKENGWSVDDSYYDAYQAWAEDLTALHRQPAGIAEGLDPFFAGCMRQLLAGGAGENRVCSPLNIYMALAMLAEVTDGESRQQILELLGSEGLDALRQQAAALWQQSYQDDGLIRSVLASSLWMRQDMSYVPETLENLAKYYYAASFRGVMGSPEYDALLQSWINEQTGGLLEKQASGLQMSPETVLALAATVYFKAPWNDRFYESMTRPDVFHAADGDQTLDYMFCSYKTGYYWGEHFTAVGKSMENGGCMWLILPDEGVTPEELLNDAQAMEFMLLPGKYDWENRMYLKVNMQVPKFDVSSDLDLIGGLQALGVTDVFNPAVSDFSPLTRDADRIAVTQVKHAARVLIDEEGCEAAAYTVMMMEATAAFEEPPEEIDFILDRPFLFVLTNAGGLPLFVGLVQHPAG